MAGNAAMVMFDITILEEVAVITQADLDAAVAAESAALEADIQALLDAQEVTDAEIQALIDAAIEAIPEVETGCTGSIGSGSTFIIFGVAAVVAGAALFFIRKP